MRKLSTTKRDELDRMPGNKLGTRVRTIEEAGYWRLQEWEAPAAASTTAVLAATALANGATTTVVTGITNPAHPRALSVTGSAGTVNGNVVITGTDYDDETITETIACTAASTDYGTQAFKTVTQIVLPAYVAPGETISVGYSDVLGLKTILPLNTVFATYFNGALEGTAPTITMDADEVCKNTADPNSALDGAGNLVIIWLDVQDRDL